MGWGDGVWEERRRKVRGANGDGIGTEREQNGRNTLKASKSTSSLLQ